MTRSRQSINVVAMVDDATSKFWRSFLSSREAQEFANPRLHEDFSIGEEKEDADEGAKLILEGLKTATSGLPSAYGNDPGPPFPGVLSVLLDGSKRPVAVLETLEVNLRKLSELDEGFARDYGEWDRTLATLRSELTAYYMPLAQNTDNDDRDDIELLCERFRVVFRAT